MNKISKYRRMLAQNRDGFNSSGLTMDGSVGLWEDIQSTREWAPETPGFESWPRQRKETFDSKSHASLGVQSKSTDKYTRNIRKT